MARPPRLSAAFDSRAHQETVTWTCPQCGRAFARNKQSHSCDARSVASHFEGKDPKLAALFNDLVQKLGETRVDAAKTSIHLVSTHAFGGVTVRRDHLRVEFLSRRVLESARIVKTEPLGRRYAYHVIVRELSDIDKELIDWLAEAQAMQASRK